MMRIGARSQGAWLELYGFGKWWTVLLFRYQSSSSHSLSVDQYHRLNDDHVQFDVSESEGRVGPGCASARSEHHGGERLTRRDEVESGTERDLEDVSAGFGFGFGKENDGLWFQVGVWSGRYQVDEGWERAVA